MRTFLAVAVLLPGLGWMPLRAELPEFYKVVDRMVWVVSDLDKTLAGWRRLGFQELEDPVDADLDMEYRGKRVTARLRVASGRIGDTPVHWIQPHSVDNAYGEFLARHGNGVFSLVHRVPTVEALEQELARLKGLGVGILQAGSLASDAGPIRYVFLDTEAGGKYSLGLIHVPGDVQQSPLAVPDATSGRRISQFAFVVRNLEAVSRYWERLGFPAMDVTHPQTRDLVYRGKPGVFRMELGWQRHGKVVYEWVHPLQGPSTYHEYFDRHGEGLHHIAFQVAEMDREIAEWTARGFPMSQGGAWGEKDKPGSGRFAYMDTQAIGGIEVELLWSYK